MAKSLLLDVLVNVLGSYVDGLSAENLRVGVWSGKVELSNLKLKSTALDTLNLPIRISHGALKHLRLKIPWSHLESKPVRVVIDGVYLQCGPLDVSSLTVEELRARVLAGKRERLKAAMQVVLSAEEATTGSATDVQQTARQASYIQQLTTKIVDNIEITLTNVHIRYEDSSTIPGKTFSAGVTIESITLATTDDKWVETFVDQIKSHDSSVHKLGRMVNLGVYWSTRSERLEGLTSEPWERAMQRRIFSQGAADPTSPVGSPSTPGKALAPALSFLDGGEAGEGGEGGGGGGDVQHLLALPNNMSVKLTHNEAPVKKESVPKLDVVIEIARLGFNIDNAQYQQILLTTNRFAQLDRQKQMALHRPVRRPTASRQDARAWWKYSYKLVTGSDLSLQRKIDDMIMVMKKKGRYITLVKQAHMAEGDAAVLAKIDAEISAIEDSLPITSLLVFRQISALQIIEESKAVRKDKVAESSISGMTSRITSMFSWGKKTGSSANLLPPPPASKKRDSAPASLEDDDEALMIKIKSTLHQAEAAGVESFMLRLRFSSSAQLDVTTSLRPLISAELAMDAFLEIHAKNIAMSYSLSNLNIQDRFTPSPLSRYLVVARNDLDADDTSDEATMTPRRSKSSLSSKQGGKEGAAVVELDIREGVSTLHLTSLPVEITWNHQCIQQLLLFFNSPPSDGDSVVAVGAAASSSPLLGSSLNRFALENALPTSGSFEINIEINAPKIVVPESSTRDQGCLLLDSGFLTITGAVDTGGMRWDIQLSQVNVGMPHSYADRYRHGDAGQGGAYLVKPFDIRTVVQNKETKFADLSVDIRIAPAVGAELDAVKISRLLRTIQGVTLSLQGDESTAALSPQGLTPTPHFAAAAAAAAAGADVPPIPLPSKAASLKEVAGDRVQLALQIQLPAVTVDLAVTPAHVVVLAITTMDMRISSRPHDTEMIFKLNSLSLRDPLRHPSQQFLIHTATSSRHTHLITFMYTAFSSTKSPLFAGHGTEVRMDFAQMALNIDPNAVLRLKPLLESLADVNTGDSQSHSLQSLQYGGGASESPDAKSEAHQRLDRATPSPVTAASSAVGAAMPAYSAAAAVASAPTGPPGMKILIAVDKISVDLMRSRRLRRQTSKSKRAGMASDMSSSSLVRSGSGMLLEGAVEIDPLTAVEILEVAYSLDMAGFSADIKSLKLSEVKMFLESFDIVDKRAVSEKYAYKSLLCRSTVAAEHSSRSRPSVKQESSRAPRVSGLFAGVAEDADDESRLQKSIFYLLYKEQSAQRTTVELALKDVTSFIAVDSIVDIVNVGMENVDAVVSLLDALNASTKEMAAAAAARAAAAAAQAAANFRSGSVYVSSSSFDAPRLDRFRSRSVSSAGLGSPPAGALVLSQGGGVKTRGARVKHAKQKDVMDAILEEEEGEQSPSRAPATAIAEGQGEEEEEEEEEEKKVEEEEKNDNHADAEALAGDQVSDAFTLDVVVKVENPRLIFLEDPENGDSRAIVGRCGINVHYCNDIKHKATGEAKEKLHVSLHSSEVFVLMGMMQGFPQQIIEPTGLELLLNRTIEQNIELAVGLSVDVEKISGRLSFNDLALARSILARASLAVHAVSGSQKNASTGRDRLDSLGIDASSDEETSSNPSSDRAPHSRSNSRARAFSSASDAFLDMGRGAGAADQKIASSAKDAQRSSGQRRASSAPIQHLTMYDVNLVCGKISLVAIDDSDNKNMPVARLAVDKAVFQATGASIQTNGVGSMVIQAEHYNPTVAVWEPIIESCQPSIKFNQDNMTTSLDVSSDELVFINVSGAMTKSVARAINLVSLISAENIDLASPSLPGQQRYHPFVLHNELGLPIDVFDSLSTKKLVSLDADQTLPLPPANKDSYSARSVHRIDVFSSNVDVRICGSLANLRLPLFQLPLSVNCTRPYYLQLPNFGAGDSGSSSSISNSSNSSSSSAGGGGSKAVAMGGPIVEECFENERFDLVKGWSKPWTSLGDPQNWSDRMGQIARERTKILLPSDRWEWVDDRWSVDMAGAIGTEIDEGGWEYATSFPSFTLSKARRSRQPLDSVRRRRWVRTRALKASVDVNDATRPLTLYWDVSVLPNGSRSVRARSGLQVRNMMPFAIEVIVGLPGTPTAPASQLDKKGWKHRGDADIIGPIAEGATMSLPLLLTHATNIRVRPHHDSFPNPNPMEEPPSFDWSEPLDCRLRAADNKSEVTVRTNLVCNPRGSCGDYVAPAIVQPLNLRAGFCQSLDHNRVITINPLAVFVNRLPCEIAYRCKSRASGKAGRVEQGVLSAGVGVCKLLYVDLSNASLSIKLGNFAWSEAIPVVDVPDGTVLASLVGKEDLRVVDLAHPTDKDQDGQITVSVTVTRDLLICVRVFSKHAFVDATGLDMVVRCIKLVNGTSAYGDEEAQAGVGLSSLDEAAEDLKVGVQRPMLTRRAYGSAPPGNAALSWAHGGNGVALFQSASSKVSLGVKRGKCWIEGISLVVLSGGKVPFQVVDAASKRAYLLAYTFTRMDGFLKQTHLLKAIPAYVIVNCMDEPLELRQAETPSGSQSLVIPSGGSAGWHVVDRDCGSGTAVHLRTESSTWSLGCIDVNDIGTSIVILPYRDGYAGDDNHAAPSPSRMLLAHVEVKFAEANEDAYITVVVWRQTMVGSGTTPAASASAASNSVTDATDDADAAAAAASCESSSSTAAGAEGGDARGRSGSRAAARPDKPAPASTRSLVIEAELSVRNDTDLPLTLQQAGIDFKAAGYENGSKFEICVPPQSWVPYGWADPAAGSVAIASVGTSLGGDAILEMIDMLRVGETTKLDLSHLGFLSEEIVVRVVALGSSKVLHVTRQHRLTKEQLKVKREDALERQPHNYIVKLSIAALSVSVVAEQPVRREFAALCFQGTEARVLFKGASSSFRSSTSYEVKVMDLVVDNYSETAVYPVLLESRDTRDKRRIRELRKKRTESQEQRQERRKHQAALKAAGISSGASVMSAESGASRTSRSSLSRGSTGSVGGDESETWDDSYSDFDFAADGQDESTLDPHFLILSALQEAPLYATTVIFREVAIRMLELEVMADSSTLQLFFVDLFGDLLGVSDGLGSGSSSVGGRGGGGGEDWGLAPVSSSSLEFQRRFNVAALNKALLAAAAGPSCSSIVDASAAQAAAQRFKVYFDSFVMHPLKFRISFMPTPFPPSRPKEQDVFSNKAFRTLRRLKGLLEVQDLVIKVGRIALQNEMDSIGSISAKVATTIAYDLKQHVMRLAGSLLGGASVIGKPAGLFRNLSEMRVASGIVASTASIVGSTSLGVAKGGSFLSGDRDFRERREEKRRVMNATGGGVKHGVKAGAESIYEGFKSGLTGLVKRPFEEGQKTGALGFMKGVGLGLAGALTKPVVGITDGIGMAATGVSNRLNNVVAVSHLRPARSFSRSPSDYSALVLCNWDPHAAAAQEFVRERARKGGYSDDFASYVALGGHPDTHRSIASRSYGSIIISNEKIFRMADGDTEVLWVFPFGNVSHCLFREDEEAHIVAVDLVVYTKIQEEHEAAVGLALSSGDVHSGLGGSRGIAAGGNTETLKCASREIAIFLYAQLAKCAARMGNPSSVLPVDIATAPKVKEPENPVPQPLRTARGWKFKPAELLSRADNAALPGGLVGLEGTQSVGVGGWQYQFGSANKNPVKRGSWGEQEVLQRAASRLLRETDGFEGQREQEESEGKDTRARRVDDQHRSIDERVWQLVGEWTCTHAVLNTSRCLALVLLNHSLHPVQILRVEMQEGKNYQIMGVGVGGGFDPESRAILPGGAVVLFAYAFRPSPIDLAHVKVLVQTSAFTTRASTRPNRTECSAVGGFTVGYLEKSLSDVWGKCVLLIT